MKKLLIILTFFHCPGLLFSQNRQIIDSILQLPELKKQDSNLVIRYNTLGRYYTPLKPDSNLYYTEKALLLGEKIKYKRGIAQAYQVLSSGYKVKSDYPMALEFLQKSKKIYSELNDESKVLFLEYAEGTLNWTQGEYREALKIFLYLMPILEKRKDGNLINIYPFLASTYTKLLQPDSGLFYIRKSNPENLSLDLTQSFPLVIMGDSYFLLHKLDSALVCFRMAFNRPQKTVLDYIFSSIGISRVYKSYGKADSCIYYASLALSESQANNFRDQSIIASKLLAEVFEKTNPQESIRYYKLTSALNDSVFGQQKIKQVQSLKYTEDIRKREMEEKERETLAKLRLYLLTGGAAVLLLVSLILLRNNRQKQKAKSKIEKAYRELRDTQSQLIQSEKMASLGEMTAGIAHEIQNPLNFVNNFSELNAELIEDLKSELVTGNQQQAIGLADNIKDNEQKIMLHGKRADAIVKSMLQHSRSSTGVKEPTDINILVDEYLRLAYHGLRAKDKSFNATMNTDFDASIGKINIVPQDMGRVILNLITNAFYAVASTGSATGTVWVSTKKTGNKVLISVRDNGHGIPQKIQNKIFQPFFTTKPTGQGTGLGLSLSYDIVKAHSGVLRVETKEGEGSEFIIQLPVE